MLVDRASYAGPPAPCLQPRLGDWELWVTPWTLGQAVWSAHRYPHPQPPSHKGSMLGPRVPGSPLVQPPEPCVQRALLAALPRAPCQGRHPRSWTQETRAAEGSSPASGDPAYTACGDAVGVARLHGHSSTCRPRAGQPCSSGPAATPVGLWVPRPGSRLPHLAPTSPGTSGPVWGSPRCSSSPPGRGCHSPGRRPLDTGPAGHRRTPQGRTRPLGDGMASRPAAPGPAE